MDLKNKFKDYLMMEIHLYLKKVSNLNHFYLHHQFQSNVIKIHPHPKNVQKEPKDKFRPYNQQIPTKNLSKNFLNIF